MNERGGFMTRRLVGLAAVGAVGATMGLGAGVGSAQGATINQMLLELANDAGVVGEESVYRLRDADWGIVVNDDGQGGFQAKDASTSFSVGDVVLGAFEMDDVRQGASGSTYEANMGQDGNNYFFGRYAIEITSIVPNDPADPTAGAKVHFGVASGLDPFGTGDNTTFEFYEAASNPFDGQTIDSSNFAGWDLVGTGGHSLWASAGFESPGDQWVFDTAAGGADGWSRATIQEWYNAPEGVRLASGDDQVLSWILGPDQGLDGHLIGDYAERWLTLTNFTVGGS